MARNWRWLPRSLVGRVFALYTGVLVAFMAAGLGLFYRDQFSTQVEDAQQRADALAAVLQPPISDNAVIGDYDAIRRTLDKALYHSAFEKASFIDLRGSRVEAARLQRPDVVAPGRLLRAFEERLLDVNLPISVGGRDYGVVRLHFNHEQIAAAVWQRTRAALALGAMAVLIGLLLIRFALERWLGRLQTVKAFEAAVTSGSATPALPTAGEAPSEFRDTFEVLGRVAATLQAQRAQADVTLGAINDGVITLDLDGRVLLVNPAAGEMAGADAADLRGQLLADLVPDTPLPTVDGRLQPWRHQRRTLLREGRELVLDTSLSPITTPDGKVAGHVLTLHDVTERDRLEQRLRDELQQRESALVALRQLLESLDERSRPRPGATSTDDLSAITALIGDLTQRLRTRGEQLDAIFALSADGFISFDALRRVRYVSPQACRIMGWVPEQLLGRSRDEVDALIRSVCGGELQWRGLPALREAGEGLPPEEAPHDRIEVLRPRRRTVELGLSEGAQGDVQVLSIRDVTHEVEVDQMKSEFLSTAAHEMRTPMASIFGFVELMLTKPLKPERQREMLEIIHRQSQLMIHIVNELLDLARIEARRGSDFVLEAGDLAALTAEVVHDFQPPAGRDLPRLRRPDGPLPVMVDRAKLAQALGNILSNAYKYSPGGGAVDVTVLPDRHDPRRVGVAIRDHGIGLSEAELARVGERFFRADTSGNIPGTGLGMSIVKEIVGLLGGTLALDSAPGEGTTVTLWLPRAEAAATTWTAAAAAPAADSREIA